MKIIFFQINQICTQVVRINSINNSKYLGPCLLIDESSSNDFIFYFTPFLNFTAKKPLCIIQQQLFQYVVLPVFFRYPYYYTYINFPGNLPLESTPAPVRFANYDKPRLIQQLDIPTANNDIEG